MLLFIHPQKINQHVTKGHIFGLENVNQREIAYSSELSIETLPRSYSQEYLDLY